LDFHYTQFGKMDWARRLADELMSENFEQFVDGVESIWPIKRDENCAGQRDGDDGENRADAIWRFLAEARGMEKPIDANGKILIHAS
jgi:hypothetical protein